MNNVVSLSQLITRLAKVTDTDINTSRRFLRSLFAAVEEQLLAGESVTIKGIGTFRPNVDGLVAQGQSVLFIPDAELAAAVNAPFDMFEPVELAGGVNFDDEAEEIAPEALESAATAEAPAAVEKEVEEVEVPEEVRDEESPAAEHEDVAAGAVVSEPEAETEELAETEASIPE
ncbi:MAG: HU family DNA-binding protein, partial [Muribaculaceae bacterium]|nr:HU family DNA-binding protein [Muribaculaceae bacterium]